MLLFVLHELWSIIDDSGAVVSSVVPSYPALLSFHMLAGHLDRAPFAVFWRSSNEIQYPLGKGSVPLYLATSSKTPRPTIDLTLAASPCTVPSGRGGGALLYILFSR